MEATELEVISETLMRIVTPDMTPKQFDPGGTERASERVKEGHRPRDILFDIAERVDDGS